MTVVCEEDASTWMSSLDLRSQHVGTTAVCLVSLGYNYCSVARMMMHGDKGLLHSWAASLEVVVCALAVVLCVLNVRGQNRLKYNKQCVGGDVAS